TRIGRRIARALPVTFVLVVIMHSGSPPGIPTIFVLPIIHAVRLLGIMILLHSGRESWPNHHRSTVEKTGNFYQAFIDLDMSALLLVHIYRKTSTSDRDNGSGRTHAK